MTRILVLSIVLSLGFGLFVLMGGDSEAVAAPIKTYSTGPMSSPVAPADRTRTYIADTGMITLGPNKFLRMTVTPRAQRSRVTSLTVTFSAHVTQSVCSGGLCTHTTATQYTTAPSTLMLGQAASYDILQTSGGSAVRGIVTGDSAEMLVNGLIIDSTTGQAEEVLTYTVELTNAV